MKIATKYIDGGVRLKFSFICHMPKRRNHVKWYETFESCSLL